jgi:hypothetical protein
LEGGFDIRGRISAANISQKSTEHDWNELANSNAEVSSCLISRNEVNQMDNIKSASVEQVIVVKTVKGSGTEKDPARMVVQYWDLDGNFLFELDA